MSNIDFTGTTNCVPVGCSCLCHKFNNVFHVSPCCNGIGVEF